MRSDHWNFLANLLGTPAPAEPPKPNTEEPTPAVESESPEERKQDDDSADKAITLPEMVQAEDHREDVAQPAKKTASSKKSLDGFGSGLGFDNGDDHDGDDHDQEPEYEQRRDNDAVTANERENAAEPANLTKVEENAQPVPAAENLVAPADDLNVIDALTSVAPPPVLPGFGAPARDPGQSSYDKPKTYAGEHESLDSAMDELAAQGDSIHGDSTTDEENDSRQQRSRRGGRDRDASRDRETRDRPRRENRSKRDEASAKPSEAGNDFENRSRRSRGGRDDDRESEERGGRPRRRGRRGARQRMSEEDLNRDEKQDSFGGFRSNSNEESASDYSTNRHEETLDEERSSRSRRGRRGREGRDRERTEPDRSGSGRGRRARGGRDRDESLSDDREVDEVQQSSDELGTDDIGQAETETRERSRRRGRRGGRGRGRDRNDAREEERLDESDPLSRKSAFDDDYEDDFEAEEIRRDRRSSRSGQGREGSGREEAREQGGRSQSRRKRDGQSRGRDGDSRDQDAQNRDTQDRDSRGSRGRGRDAKRREDVPTWLETVDMFVDHNIDNHKKSRGSGRGGRGRRR